MEKKDSADAVAEPTQKKEPKPKRCRSPRPRRTVARLLSIGTQERIAAARLPRECVLGASAARLGEGKREFTASRVPRDTFGPGDLGFPPPEFRPRVAPLFTLRKHLQGKL